MDKTDELIGEYWQAAKEKEYNDVRAECLLALACSQQAEERYGSLERAVAALLLLCRTCKDDAECEAKFCGEA